MILEKEIVETIDKIRKLSSTEKKYSGFCIGNTAKYTDSGPYLTPVRITSSMVFGGIIVFNDKKISNLINLIDGKVDYVLVDSERKTHKGQNKSNFDIEDIVRNQLSKSKLFSYKGNDLTVSAIDYLLSYLYRDTTKGLRHKKITILGAGNIGSKLGLKLIERGAKVVLTRNDKDKLKIISRAINVIKPEISKEEIVYEFDNTKASKGAEVLIGTTDGKPAITAEIVESLDSSAIIIDVGKGVLFNDASEVAHRKGIKVYRLDVSPSFDGMISTFLALEDIIENKQGRRIFLGEKLVSGGLLGKFEEIVVDNINAPRLIYGFADGQGDIISKLSDTQRERLQHFTEQLDETFE